MIKIDNSSAIALLNKSMTDEVTVIQLSNNSFEELFRYHCMPCYEAKKLLKYHIDNIFEYLTIHCSNMSIDTYSDYVSAYYRETNGKVDTLILAFQEISHNMITQFESWFSEYLVAHISVYDGGV